MIDYWPLVMLLFLVIYQVFNYVSFKKQLDRVGREYCVENDFEYIGIKHAKTHFSVIYKAADSGKRKYKKFRMNTSLIGKISFLEWLK